MAFPEAANGGRVPLWLDYAEYIGALLGEPEPLLDVDSLVGWQRRATGLVETDVIPIDLAALLDRWCSARPALRTAMAARRRPTAPLRVLLADEDLGAHLADLVSSLRSALPGKAVVLVSPAPDDLAAAAYRAAFEAPTPDLDEDDVDSAAVYLAGMLRALSTAGLDALVILAPESGRVTADRIELYGPVRNVAAHYRWNVGLAVAGPPPDLPDSQMPAFWLTDVDVSGRVTGIELAAAVWDGAPIEPAPERGFRRARIPVGARPEHVLERIAALREP